MRIPTRAVSVACSLFLGGALPAGAEDVTIVYNVAHHEGGTQLRYKFISPGRTEAWSGPDYGFITDSTGKTTRIDHRRWEYTETTEQEDEAAQRAVLQRRIDRDASADSSASLDGSVGVFATAGLNESAPCAGSECPVARFGPPHVRANVCS
jgi:hypothetical protein